MSVSWSWCGSNGFKGVANVECGEDAAMERTKANATKEMKCAR
jgi:hypothetical protein